MSKKAKDKKKKKSNKSIALQALIDFIIGLLLLLIDKLID